MQQVEVRHSFNHSADTLWQLTGDFAGLQHWLPGITSCTVEGNGPCDQGGNAVRSVQLMDGSVTRESLESFDPANRHYRYAILSAKGFDPAQTYIGTFHVIPTGDNRCDIHWQANFTLPADLPADKVDKACDKIRNMYAFFLQQLAARLG